MLNTFGQTSSLIARGSLLTSLAVLMQGGPLYLPILGLLLSSLATLPILLAMLLNPALGFLTYLSSFLILFFLSTQESVIFLFTTGLLGLCLGYTLYHRYPTPLKITFSALALTAGMLIMQVFIGINPFGGFLAGLKLLSLVPVYFCFSLCWSALWSFLTVKLRLYKVSTRC